MNAFARKLMLKHTTIFYAVITFFGVLFGIMAIANHYYFRTTAFDYGPYNFAFQDYAHFHISTCYIYKVFVNGHNITFLQDHFSFLLMYFVPIYWLLNWLTGTYTLLIIQTAFIIWGAYATYKLVILKTTNGWLGVAAVVYYFLLQGRYSAFDEDCNIIIMAACFVPVFIWYFESKKYWAAFIIFLLAMFSREDMPLWFIFVFVVLLIWHRKERKLVYACLGYMVASVICLLVTFKIFIPLIENPKYPYNLFNYGALGDNPQQAFIYILKHPIDTIGLFFRNQSGSPQNDGIKLEFYLVYFLSGGFILFFRPKYIIWFIPLIAQKMLNDDPVRWSIESYYTIQIATLFPLAVFLIVGQLSSGKLQIAISMLLCALALSVTIYENNPAHHKSGYPIQVKRDIFNKSFFNPPYNTKAITEDLKLIPPDARVSASASILPHLAQRKYIYEFPYVNDAEYIAVFAFPDFFKVSANNYCDTLYRSYILDPHWEIIANDFPFYLLKKAGNKPRDLQYDSITCDIENRNNTHKNLMANDAELLDYDTATWNNEKVRSGKHSIKLTKEKPWGFIIHPDNLTTGDILYISVWHYSKDNNGCLSISNGNDRSITTSSGIKQDSAGWEKLELYCGVPADHSTFKIYVWNNGNGPVWFDDLEIKRIKYSCSFLNPKSITP